MDFLIKGGTVIDGRGTPGFAADVAVSQGKISDIGSIPSAKGARVLDAAGMAVSPGFVDILNHSDAYLTLLRNPASESLLAQGVTTAIIGNCGASLAPFPHGRLIAVVQKWGETQGINVDWERFGEFLEIVERLKPGMNVASLVGHTTVRRAILGDEARPPSDEELEKMRFLVEEAIAEGAMGLSYAPAYLHARQAPEWEIERLLEPVAKAGRYLAVHLRHEDDRLLASFEEALSLASRAGTRLEISHFKYRGAGAKQVFARALERLAEVHARGQGEVRFDMYPYDRMTEVLYTLLPEWAQEGGLAKMLERLRHTPTRARVAEEMTRTYGDGLAQARVLVARREPSLVGKTVGELAKSGGMNMGEAIAGLFLANDGKVILLQQSFQEEGEAWEAAAHDAALVGSAGAGYSLRPQPDGEQPHPRSFGAFPRMLVKAVREHKKLSLAEAISRMTHKTAEHVGLRNRGVIARGAFADLVVFDPEKLEDRATFANPWQAPKGIKWVIVNGKIVIEDGKPTGIREGKVLRQS